MKLPIYQIDAFSSKTFKGNPAAVCPLEKWLDDETLQQIAEENNLAETAFYVNTDKGFEIRWFTPVSEVDLCWHATLASAHVLFNHYNFKEKEITFSSNSGPLKVRKEGDSIVLNFPVNSMEKAKLPDGMLEGLGVLPFELYQNKDFLLVLESEEEVRSIKPNFDVLKKVPTRGIIVTAKGDKVDFVSRFFAPRVGVNEDPVTGSAHSTLIPYWSQKLHKKEMVAEQLSKRGGTILCTHLEDRVEMKGSAVTYLIGEIQF
jgi:PhzF family phenazine biosynthesis protein